MIHICLGTLAFLAASTVPVKRPAAELAKRPAAELAKRPTAELAKRPTAELAKRHCQVPCGIYGDMMRIDMFLEDVATIEKGMKMIGELSAATPINYNQLVRWVNNKDTHAQAIQDNVAAYWLAQRIKAPKAGKTPERYLTQLALLHSITVAAMKCKQTTDKGWAEKIRVSVKLFNETYFTEAQRKHLREHHGAEHKHK